jgi:1,4-dihydroxy-2-naphthoate octaprenyltransferase
VILIPAWAFYLIGAAEARSNASSRGAFPSMVTALSLTAILVTAYLLNQIFDRASDEKNSKCLFLSRGVFTARTLILLAVLAFLAASYAYHETPAVARHPLELALALSFAYSLPPLRLCARPVFDLLANAIGYGGVAFVLGFGVFDPSLAKAGAASLPYVLLVGGTFLHTTILDFAGDSETGKKSTTVVIGKRASAIAAVVLSASAFVIGAAMRNPVAALVTGVSLLVAVYPLVKRSERASAFLIQANTLVVTLAAAYFWPLILAVVVPLVALSRFYHARRFGIIYPGPQKIV